MDFLHGAGDFEDASLWTLIDLEYDNQGVFFTSTPGEVITGTKSLRVRVRNSAIGPTLTGGELRIHIDGLIPGKEHHLSGQWRSVNIQNDEGVVQFFLSDTLLGTFNQTQNDLQNFEFFFTPESDNATLRIFGPAPGGVGGRDYFFDSLNGHLPPEVNGVWNTQVAPTNDQFVRVDAPSGAWTPVTPQSNPWSR